MENFSNRNILRDLTAKIIRVFKGSPYLPFKPQLRRIFDCVKSNYAKKGKVITNIKGIVYELDLNEYIDSSIYFNGYFEKDTTRAITTLCREGMYIIDIGANIGAHTLKFSQLVGKTGKVIAFEPMERASKKLKRNLELNDFDNVVVENYALSNVESKEKITVSFTNSWPIRGEAKTDQSLVSLTTLDLYVARENVSKVDIIKLDVDGYEHKVLTGSKKVLQKFKPIIVMELCDYCVRNAGDSMEDLINFLDEAGYLFYSEKDNIRYEDKNELLKSIPEEGSINVILRPGP